MTISKYKTIRQLHANRLCTRNTQEIISNKQRQQFLIYPPLFSPHPPLKQKCWVKSIDISENSRLLSSIWSTKLRLCRHKKPTGNWNIADMQMSFTWNDINTSVALVAAEADDEDNYCQTCRSSICHQPRHHRLATAPVIHSLSPG